MPTLTPTAATGAVAKPAPLLYVDPTRTHTEADTAAFATGAELNAPFFADLLSDMLAHERGGAHLYRSVAGRTGNSTLQSQYEHFGDETVEHITILEELVTQLGGDPQYVSPTARATEKSGTALVEATFLLGGNLDPIERELVMLEAVFLAEAKDHANWQGLSKLADNLPEGDVRRAVQAAVERVEPQEDEHLNWASETRTKLVLGQAQDPSAAKAGATVDELMERVANLLA